MPVSRAVKASAQTGASAPAEAPVESPATPAPEDTAGQGGDGDLDDDLLHQQRIPLPRSLQSMAVQRRGPTRTQPRPWPRQPK